MNRGINLVLAIALVIVVSMIWFLRRDYASRNAEFLPGMVVSVPYNALDPNPNFPDGKTLQSLPAGTVTGKFPPLNYPPTAEGAKLAGEELINPLSDTLVADVERGAVVFRTVCQPCHGAGALGDGTVVKRGFPPPPSLLSDKTRQLKDGQMFHILTYGQNNMPSLMSQVTRTDRWRAVLYVRSLQRSNPKPGAN